MKRLDTEWYKNTTIMEPKKLYCTNINLDDILLGSDIFRCILANNVLLVFKKQADNRQKRYSQFDLPIWSSSLPLYETTNANIFTKVFYNPALAPFCFRLAFTDWI